MSSLMSYMRSVKQKDFKLFTRLRRLVTFARRRPLVRARMHRE